MLLVPASMHVVGRLHDRFWLREGTGGGSGIPSRAA
jgi:hypothetical protein